MRKLLAILLFFLLTSNAFAFEKSYTIPFKEFEDLEIKQNGVKLNNFNLSETQAILPTGLVNINLNFSATNKQEVDRHFSIMVVGQSEGEILWCVSAEPMMSILSAQKTETIEEETYIYSGILRRTKTVWVRVFGDF